MKKAKELLVKSGGKVIGAVLNKMTIEKVQVITIIMGMSKYDRYTQSYIDWS